MSRLSTTLVSVVSTGSISCASSCANASRASGSPASFKVGAGTDIDDVSTKASFEDDVAGVFHCQQCLMEIVLL